MRLIRHGSIAAGLSLCSTAAAEPGPEPTPIETVCAHAMNSAMSAHRDQFLAEAAAEVAERDELAWLLGSTQAQWLAELNRQCIESLIPIRRELVLAERDEDYRTFAGCVLGTEAPEAMEACFLSLNHALIRTPAGAAAQISMSLNQIRDAQLRHFVVEGSYLPIPAFVPDDTPGSDPRPWPEGSPFQALGWAPEDGQAWGSYRVELVGEDDFKVIGIIDVDGDGKPMIWTATKRLEATQQIE